MINLSLHVVNCSGQDICVDRTGQRLLTSKYYFHEATSESFKNTILFVNVRGSCGDLFISHQNLLTQCLLVEDAASQFRI